MVRGEIRGPHLLGAVRGVVFGPDVIELERSLDHALFELLLEVTVQVRALARNRANAENRVAEHLKLFRNAVIEAGVGMIRAIQDQDRNAVLGLYGLQNRATLFLQVELELAQCLPGFATRMVALVFRHTEARSPSIEPSLGEQRSLRERKRGVDVLDVALLEKVDFLGERRFHDVGCAGDDGTRGIVLRVLDEARDVRENRKKDKAQRALAVGLVLVKEQIVYVRLHDLARKAGVDGAEFS